jgi:hypothetical protein
MRTQVLGLVLALAVAVGLLAYTYTESVAKISKLNEQVYYLNQSLTQAKNTIMSDEATINTQRAAIANYTKTISTLNFELYRDNITINTLRGTVQQENLTIAGLQNTVSQLNGEVNHLTRAVNLNLSVEEAVNVPVAESPSNVAPQVAQIIVNDAGYLEVTGTTNAPNGTIFVVGNYGTTQYIETVSSYFTGQFTVYLPVLPGTVTVYFTSFDNTYDSATISITYYY